MINDMIRLLNKNVGNEAWSFIIKDTGVAFFGSGSIAYSCKKLIDILPVYGYDFDISNCTSNVVAITDEYKFRELVKKV